MGTLMFFPRKTLIVLVWAMCALWLGCFADEKNAPKQAQARAPTLKITGDHIETTQEGKQITLVGNACVTYGRIALKADKIVLRRNEKLKPVPFESLAAAGKVVLVYESHSLRATKLEVDGRHGAAHATSVRADLKLREGPVHVEADRVDITLLRQTITATGSVLVRHAKGTARADSVEVNLLTREMKMTRPRIEIPLGE